ncbi:MAG: hypothetical protein II072_03775 [Clostridia bacterium]|nr:hypothetical protein [Clostridia bacterium]
MIVRFEASELSGSIDPPPFKSEVIRCLILYAMCGISPYSVVRPSDRLSDDIANACSAVHEAFFGNAGSKEKPLYVGESATLLRLLAPVLTARPGSVVFSVDPSLFRREISSLSCCTGIRAAKTDPGVITFSGAFDPHKYSIDASMTSQFASGMLLASLLVPGMELCILSPVSKPYIELTLACIRRFGGEITVDQNGVYRSSASELSPPECMEFSPDSSYIANFVAANFIMNGCATSAIAVPRLNDTSLHPDAAIGELLLLDRFSIRDCPDLFPILCVAALKKDRITTIDGIARLRGKESDRIESTAAMIRSLGGRIDIHGDTAFVHGCSGKLHDCTVDSFGDHRIVMAAAIASLMSDGPVTVLGADCVSKSAPCFFEDFRKLGGTADEQLW